MKIVLSFLLLSFICLVASSEVTVLTNENFDSSTSSGVWLIKFYAPWCGHCKKLAPTWDELAAAVGDNFHVGKVDCTEHKDVCTRYEVKGYPTILSFENGVVEKYAGQRTINDFVKFIETKYPTTPKTNLGGQAQAAPAATAAPAPPAPQPVATPAPEGSTSDVVVLTDSTFAVARSGVWLVDFYAPWCGHCKKLTPIWDDLAAVAKASGLYKVAKVDVTTEKDLGTEFGIRSLPTIKLFIDGVETPYAGDRTVDAFNKFVIEAIAKQAPKTEAVPQDAPAAPAAPVVEVEKENGVYILTNDNFDATIKGKNFFVKFYAPWCGHCKKMAPTWAEVATAHPEYNIGNVDCTIHKEICSRYGVTGYPTLILLKSDNSQVKYQNARTAEAFLAFLQQNS